MSVILNWGKIVFNNEEEYYETLGFIAKDEELLDLKTESNSLAGAWGNQLRFYWNVNPSEIDFESLPRPLIEPFKESYENDRQARLSATPYIRNLLENHSFCKSYEPDGAYIKHWHKTSLKDVMNTVPDEYISAFLRGFYWNFEINKRIKTEEEIPEENTTIITEGAKKLYFTTKYERSKKNREACIKSQGCFCHVCGFDFEITYGELGKSFIEVHHIKPLYTLDEETVIDPSKDLIPVCSNCHRMLHRFKDYMISIEELKNIVESN